MNRNRGTFDGDWCTAWDGKPVVFGFTTRRRDYGGNMNASADTVTRFGFTRDTDGSLCLVGDTYGMNMGLDFIERAVANSYVNEAVNESVPAMSDLGFFEDEAENTVQLQMLA